MAGKGGSCKFDSFLNIGGDVKTLYRKLSRYSNWGLGCTTVISIVRFHALERDVYLVQSVQTRISIFHPAFFNSVIDKHQHMHFYTFKTVLV